MQKKRKNNGEKKQRTLSTPGIARRRAFAQFETGPCPPNLEQCCMQRRHPDPGASHACKKSLSRSRVVIHDDAGHQTTRSARTSNKRINTKNMRSGELARQYYCTMNFKQQQQLTCNEKERMLMAPQWLEPVTSCKTTSSIMLIAFNIDNST